VVDIYPFPVPARMALPSQDGDYWLFFHEDYGVYGRVRCFFVPALFWAERNGTNATFRGAPLCGLRGASERKGERLIRVGRKWVDKLGTMRGPGESYPDMILRPATAETRLKSSGLAESFI
jgi:hypothetical protein